MKKKKKMKMKKIYTNKSLKKVSNFIMAQPSILVPIAAMGYQPPAVEKKYPNKAPTRAQEQRAARSALARRMARNDYELDYMAKHDAEMPKTMSPGEKQMRRYKARVKRYGAFSPESWDAQIKANRLLAKQKRDAVKAAALTDLGVSAKPSDKIVQFQKGIEKTEFKEYTTLPRSNQHKQYYVTSTGALAGGPDVLVKPLGGVVHLPFEDGHTRKMTKALTTYFNPAMGPSERRILYKIGRWVKSKKAAAVPYDPQDVDFD